MESLIDTKSEEWASLTERLFVRVQELEELMAEVRSDLEVYRVVREDWQRWHEEWKNARDTS